MFLGVFEGYSRGYKRPVNINHFFCGLYILKIKRPDCRSGLLRSWSGLVMVFFWSQDQTSEHYT